MLAHGFTNPQLIPLGLILLPLAIVAGGWACAIAYQKERNGLAAALLGLAATGGIVWVGVAMDLGWWTVGWAALPAALGVTALVLWIVADEGRTGV